MGGKLTNEYTVNGPAAGWYTSASLGAPITTIGARWTFTPRGGTPGAMALLVSRSPLLDGQHQIVRDHRIADSAGPFATFEASSERGLTDSRVGFTGIWAQSLRVKRSGR